MRVYLDNDILSADVRCDLPLAETKAVEQLRDCARQGLIEIMTSRQSWREQDLAPNPITREAFRRARPNVPVVEYDHEVFGFRCVPDRSGGFISNPAITDVIDPLLFEDLQKLSLKVADARHFMYAARNDCVRFITLDGDFLKRRERLEARCVGLRVMKPSELSNELLGYASQDLTR